MALALYDQGDEAATSCKGWSWQSWWKPFAIYDEYMTEEDFDGYDPDERYDHFEYERDMGAVAAWPPGPIAPRTLSAERRMVRGGLRVYKIVVLGDGGVGKSALTLQFVSCSFLEYHDPTIEDAYQQQTVIDGTAALLDILDTAGQVEFTTMRSQYMRCGEAFILVYSVTDRHSFEEAAVLYKLINRTRTGDDVMPVVFVGNKSDLEEQRKVSFEEGKSLADHYGCPFFETSAATRVAVNEPFHAAVRSVRAKETREEERQLEKEKAAAALAAEKAANKVSARNRLKAKWRKWLSVVAWQLSRIRPAGPAGPNGP